MKGSQVSQPTLKEFLAAFDNEARGSAIWAFVEKERCEAATAHSESHGLARMGAAMLEQQKRMRDMMERMYAFITDTKTRQQEEAERLRIEANERRFAAAQTNPVPQAVLRAMWSEWMNGRAKPPVNGAPLPPPVKTPRG